MKLKSILIYLIVVASNICIGFLLNLIFNGTNTTNFVMFALGSCVVGSLILYAISNKYGVKLDILANHETNDKHLLLNDIFAGFLFSVPIIMIFSILL